MSEKDRADNAALTGIQTDGIKDRLAFEALFAAWRRVIDNYCDPAMESSRINEIERENRDLELAWQIIAAPVPLGFLMSQKLEVLTYYAAAAGEDMAPLDRLLLTGLGCLRADVVNFCG